MKRSEMLNLIRLEFHKRLGSHNINTKDIAEKVLFKIEQAGMLPPHEDGDKYYSCYECGGDSVFKWNEE